MSHGITEVSLIYGMIFIYCNWVSTRWQWLMFSKEIRIEVNDGKPKCKLKIYEEDEGHNYNKNT
jgi:hypothetical protein